jgi:hypothetical protein
MKLATTLLAVLTITCALAGAEAAELDSGFMGTPWGAPASGLTGFTKVGEAGKIAYYIPSRQVYKIFDAEVPEVVYGFYEEKFFAVYVNLEGIDVFAQIKRYVQQKYGVPKISRETLGDLTTYSWKINSTRIKLKHYEKTGLLKMSFYYTPISSRASAEMKLEDEEGPPEPVFPLSPRRQRDAIEHLELLNF